MTNDNEVTTLKSIIIVQSPDTLCYSDGRQCCKRAVGCDRAFDIDVFDPIGLDLIGCRAEHNNYGVFILEKCQKHEDNNSPKSKVVKFIFQHVNLNTLVLVCH